MRKLAVRVILALSLLLVTMFAAGVAHSDQLCVESQAVVHAGPICVHMP